MKKDSTGVGTILSILAFVCLAVILFIGLLHQQSEEVAKRREAANKKTSSENIQEEIPEYKCKNGSFMYLTDPETGVEYLVYYRPTLTSEPYIGLGPRYNDDGSIYINPKYAASEDSELITEETPSP